TNDIAQVLMEKIKPLGAAVVIDARHMCMEMRGAESYSSPTVTSAMHGLFHKDARTREEFLSLIRQK
ncbi:MAG TPA: GTP cyclohydrolase I, partial [Elusimicrobiota bacterium]|nr:GTP cyclohydrolase I [Elusimicrobiota bacterium]